ncbi:DUF7017 domain-containing protein [Thiomicrospira microaerophila]|uniref:DUF7017 domain-containing protein n=1 Tax=Thiomicrospira microaerophila TaxID=406020 RepID=UPI000696DB6F|nr:hypothetical protein [Thiomicrospira microaerophila]
MSTAKEVFALRKSGSLNEAYKMACELMNDPNRDEWDLKAFAWCVIDLVKRDSKNQQNQNLQYFKKQLESIDVSSDEILTNQKNYALQLCSPNQENSQLVFAKRKAGMLDEAYQIGLRLIQNPNRSDWDIKAFAWVLIDLIKREVEKNQWQNVSGLKSSLEALEIDESDEVLFKSRNYALWIANPNSQQITQARQLSKTGKHQEAIQIYENLLNNGESSLDVQTSLGWEYYRLASHFQKQEPPNVGAVKNFLSRYLKLNIEKPSMLHSSFLSIADKLAQDDKLDMSVFARMWDLKNFRAEDYERYETEDGKSLPSLVEKVVLHASKHAVNKQQLEELKYFEPYLRSSIEFYSENIWLKLNYARVLTALGRSKEAVKFGIEVVKNKPNDFWTWDLLGEIHHSISTELEFSCYCKALLCSKDLKYISKVKIKLAERLIRKSELEEAKHELEEIIQYKTQHGQKIPDKLAQFQNFPWYSSTKASLSNKELYLKYASSAEELLYHDLPWINGILGETFSLKNKPNQVKRKLYIETGDIPKEITIPDTNLTFNDERVGMPVEIKGEYDANGRFQAYKIEYRESGEQWDIFQERVGVVDHVNHEKKLLHFLLNREIDGVIRFSDINDKFHEGDSISLFITQFINKNGAQYKALQPKRTNESPPASILKSFYSDVRVKDSNLGFTDCGVFIPAHLVRQYDIEDGSFVEGVAILNFNKKRSEWGWKAIRISK